MVQFHPKPKPQSTFTEKNRELQERLSIKKYGMRGLTVKMRAFLFVWLSPWKRNSCLKGILVGPNQLTENPKIICKTADV